MNRTFCFVMLAVAVLLPAAAGAQTAAAEHEVTFARDIAPILQRSCQECHRPASVAPMSLLTYEEVRPWARAIKTRTALRNKRGAMPPWFIEKDIGIQQYKNDPSLTEEEIEKIAVWADNGAPLGNPADLPPPLQFAGEDEWTIGEPDLIIESPEIVVPAAAPDKWTSLGTVPIGLDVDRYVAAVEVKEINDVPKDQASGTVGGRYVFHHMTYQTIVPDAAGRRDRPALAGSRGGPQRRRVSRSRRAGASRPVRTSTWTTRTCTPTGARRRRACGSPSSCIRRATSRR